MEGLAFPAAFKSARVSGQQLLHTASIFKMDGEDFRQVEQEVQVGS
jgi:hypothetical protein